MIIYIDIIFIENIIMNTIILYATAIILKQKVKNIRLIISAVIGSIYSILMYITKLTIYSSIISKFILSVVMAYVAFKPNDVKKIFKQIIIFYLTSFVFGGVALNLIYFLRPENINIKNGLFTGEYALKVIMLGAIMAFIIIKISIKIIKTKFNTKNMYCDINLKINEKQIATKAMIDTGNLVKEPITNTPVVIVEESLLEGIIPKEILKNLENILCGNLENLPQDIQDKYLPKLRCIPFSSLGKENGMLVGIRLDKIKIQTEDIDVERKDVIAGIYDKKITKDNKYNALIGLNLLEMEKELYQSKC